MFSLDELTRTTIKNAEENERPITIQAFISPDVPRNYVNLKKQFVGILRQLERIGGNVHVEFVEVKLGDELLFRMTGGFSLSENPSFRFKYRDNGATEITVRAVDTDGAEFIQTFPVGSGT